MYHFHLLFSGLLVALLPSGLFSQVFTAGQTTGERLTYIDFADVKLSSDFWWDGDNYSLDLNNDSVADVQFWTQWVYYSHTGSMAAQAGAISMTGIEFSSESDNPFWIRKHNAGEVIDSSLTWTSGSLSFYGPTSSGPGGGNFSGTGYMAYRIIGADTLYGWIRADRGTELGPSTLTLFEQAFVTTKSSLSSHDRQALTKLMRICSQTIFLDLPVGGGQERYLLSCFDFSGRKMFEVCPGQGTHSYDLSHLKKGAYIIRLSRPDGQSLVLKIMI